MTNKQLGDVVWFFIVKRIRLFINKISRRKAEKEEIGQKIYKILDDLKMYKPRKAYQSKTHTKVFRARETFDTMDGNSYKINISWIEYKPGNILPVFIDILHHITGNRYEDFFLKLKNIDISDVECPLCKRKCKIEITDIGREFTEKESHDQAFLSATCNEHGKIKEKDIRKRILKVLGAKSYQDIKKEKAKQQQRGRAS
jgi:uncharacterized protein (UPF0335 family)